MGHIVVASNSRLEGRRRRRGAGRKEGLSSGGKWRTELNQERANKVWQLRWDLKILVSETVSTFLDITTLRRTLQTRVLKTQRHLSNKILFTSISGTFCITMIVFFLFLTNNFNYFTSDTTTD